MMQWHPSLHRSTLAAVAVAALCPAVFSACRSEPATAGDTAMETRMQAIEDEKGIRDLMVQYGRYLDTLDFEAYSKLFAAEGEWSGQLSAYTTVKGPEAIRSAMQQAFSERVWNPDHVTNVHLISNVSIDVRGDRATGYSKWTVMSRSDAGTPYVRVSGHYDDVFVREDGRWKFLSRVARREMP